MSSAGATFRVFSAAKTWFNANHQSGTDMSSADPAAHRHLTTNRKKLCWDDHDGVALRSHRDYAYDNGIRRV